MSETGWWGAMRLDGEGPAYRRVGPLQAWLQARPGELVLALHRTGDPLDPGTERRSGGEAPPIEPGAEERRAALPPGVETISLLPALADRAVVVRPEAPLQVPSGVTATLSVSVPAWLRVEAAGHVLWDLPLHRPSDTWFGPSSREGELAYASRTLARVGPPVPVAAPARARSVLRLRNAAADALLVERVALPVPRLALYADREGALWTEDLEVERQPGGGSVEVRIRRGPPEFAQGAVAVGEPREAAPENIFVRALAGLLG